MTPGARVAAAIAILDSIRGGTAAEQALTTWARSSRFAGSKDRVAIRDHVFDVLRARRSLGDGDGRSLMLALAQREGWDLSALFSGEGHAPPPPAASELASLPPTPDSEAAACDIPDWLWPHWVESLGASAADAAKTLQSRAPVFLRVNLRRSSLADAAASLADDEILTSAHPTLPTCLTVTAHPRRVKMSAAYAAGWVELQDAASQWAVGQLPLQGAHRILDYCAGGGGKALAIADQSDGQVYAHDIAPQRMRDLPVRAERAGATIKVCDLETVRGNAPYDLVFCDAPCSGAGTWRRSPDAKWQMTQERLTTLTHVQGEVLDAAKGLVRSGGHLAYATCSVLECENTAQIKHFVSDNPGWSVVFHDQRLPDLHGDGFFLAVLKNNL